MKTVACTVCSGNYHYGVAALANSLHAVGYVGNFWIGYQGDLPPWVTDPINKEGYSQYSVTPNFKLQFIRLPTDMFISKYKPFLMRRVFEF